MIMSLIKSIREVATARLTLTPAALRVNPG